jgi:hypothetical protein
MAASGSIPSFRISGSVRFDPDEVATWLNEKQAPGSWLTGHRCRGAVIG